MSVRKWPEDFQDFQGNFDKMVTASKEAVKAALPKADAPSEGLLRHYQAKGALGRGERSGRSNTYGFRELAEIVATKALIEQGWRIDHIAKIRARLETRDLVALPYSDAQPSDDGLPVAAQSYCQPIKLQPSAVDVVEEMLKSAGLNDTSASSSYTKAGFSVVQKSQKDLAIRQALAKESNTFDSGVPSIGDFCWTNEISLFPAYGIRIHAVPAAVQCMSDDQIEHICTQIKTQIFNLKNQKL